MRLGVSSRLIACASAGQAGMNERFDNTPLSEMKSLTGVTSESWGAVQRMPRADFSFINDTAIPDSFDSETNWPKCAKVIGDIRDQSNCGCCWAFAGTSAASDRMCIATQGKLMVPLSARADARTQLAQSRIARSDK